MLMRLSQHLVHRIVDDVRLVITSIVGSYHSGVVSSIQA